MRTWKPGERYDVPFRGRPPTLADFDPAQRFEVTCCFADCRHRTLWTRDLAIYLLGERCTVVQAERRLLCGRCRSRQPATFRPYSIDADDIRFGRPYASWPRGL